MRTPLHPEELNAWNKRFESFYDAVVNKWAVDYLPSEAVLELVIEAQDQISPSGWSLVTFRLSGISSLKFCEGPKMSYQVLSAGLHILFDDGCVALEFGDFISAPESILELMNSPCHVVAKLLEWEAQFIL